VTSEEAKRILLLYRPRTTDAADAEMNAALEQARRDPVLQEWFDRHCEGQASLQRKFGELPVPEDLKDAILAGRKIVRPAFWWQKPAWLAAAAVVAILLGAGALWLRSSSTDGFNLYRARMVRVALHEYRMDIVTNDLRQVRRYLGTKGGPSDFPIPNRLEQLGVIGGGHIRWGKEPASMVCFDRGGGQMLFLFVINSAAIKGEPERPTPLKIGALQTLSWTQGAHTCILAGPDDPDFLQKYGPDF
jgi:hypothetical protein